MLEVRHIVGLDLGQVSDYTALVALRREQEVMEMPKPRVVGLRELEQLASEPVMKPPARTVPAWYSCNIAERFDRGTPYTILVEKVAKLFQDPRFAGQALVVDGTGVGRPVVDLFRKARINCRLVPVTITGGAISATIGQVKVDEWGYWHVPKKELVGSVQVLLGTDRLRVAPGLQHATTLTSELKNFRYKINSQTANVSLECLTGDTLVTTRNGPVPIRCVEKGQDVLTRFGYNKVLWAGETKRVALLCEARFDNGQIIRGTPDHLVWTENRGWVELENLTCADLCIPTPNSPGSTESLTTAAHPTITTSLESGESGKNFIGKYGSSFMDQSLKDSIFTMLMKTGITTTYRTWNACQTVTTRKGTIHKNRTLPRSVRPARRNLLACLTDGQTPSKMNTAKGAYIALGSASTTEIEPHADFNASNAKSGSNPRGLTPWSSSVPPNAKGPTNTCIGNTRPPTAAAVAECSKLSTGARYTVHVSAPPGIARHCEPVNLRAPPICARLPEPAPVYDLIVDGAHEFYANGILVHNSWREADHDDLVLGLALAAWYGERGRQELWVR